MARVVRINGKMSKTAAKLFLGIEDIRSDVNSRLALDALINFYAAAAHEKGQRVAYTLAREAALLHKEGKINLAHGLTNDQIIEAVNRSIVSEHSSNHGNWSNRMLSKHGDLKIERS